MHFQISIFFLALYLVYVRGSLENNFSNLPASSDERSSGETTTISPSELFKKILQMSDNRTKDMYEPNENMPFPQNNANIRLPNYLTGIEPNFQFSPTDSSDEMFLDDVFINSMSISQDDESNQELIDVNSLETRLWREELLFNSDRQLDVQESSRSKRGIALKDEDFDVTVGPGIKQGWDDNMDLNKTYGHYITSEAEIEEGSGTIFSSDLTDRMTHKLSNPISSMAHFSPDVSNTLEQRSTRIHPSIASDVKRLDFTSSDSPHISEIISVSENVTPELIDHDQTTNRKTGNGTTAFPKFTTSIEIPVIGDFDVCLNYTCDDLDIVVNPQIVSAVPEGTTMTFSCVHSNTTELGTLQWYRSNGNDSIVLESTGDAQELQFAVSQMQIHHSGAYVCTRTRGDECCHSKVDLVVYKMPDYTNHMMVVGIVAGASVLVCVMLAICKRRTVKSYAKDYDRPVQKPLLI